MAGNEKVVNGLFADKATENQWRTYKSIVANNDWTRLGIRIGLKIPDLVDLDLDKTLNKEVRFLGFKVFERTEPVAENTLRKFTDWIVSMNYEKLISIEDISSKYEIERIICGITEDRIGVPISEIELHHSFTKDLGID